MSYPEIPYDFNLDQRPSTEEIINRLPVEYRAKLRETLIPKLKAGKPIKIFCDGCFDMFHLGHSRMFEQAKKLLSGVEVYLVAGVCAEVDILKYKGKPVRNTRIYSKESAKSPF